MPLSTHTPLDTDLEELLGAPRRHVLPAQDSRNDHELVPWLVIGWELARETWVLDDSSRRTEVLLRVRSGGYVYWREDRGPSDDEVERRAVFYAVAMEMSQDAASDFGPGPYVLRSASARFPLLSYFPNVEDPSFRVQDTCLFIR